MYMCTNPLILEYDEKSSLRQLVLNTDYGHRHKSKISEKLGRCGRQEYSSAVTINLGLGFDFRPCSEGDFLTGCP